MNCWRAIPAGENTAEAFENRTRFLRQTIRAVREAVGDDFIVACRFNVVRRAPVSPMASGAHREDIVEIRAPREPVALVKRWWKTVWTFCPTAAETLIISTRR